MSSKTPFVEVVWGQCHTSVGETVLEDFDNLPNRFLDRVKFLNYAITPFQSASKSFSTSPAGKSVGRIPIPKQLVGVGMDEGWIDAAIAKAMEAVPIEVDWSAPQWDHVRYTLSIHGSFGVCFV